MERQELRDFVGLKVAQAYSALSTCPRRSVGCLLVDEKGRPLSVGYNGVASGRRHCKGEHECPGAGLPSGEGLHLCEAIHAEQNAILQLRDPDRVHTAYVTTFPCHSCIKLLLGTSCQRIVYLEGYPHKEAMDWWKEAGREIIHIAGGFTLGET
jgi:dCMP deaminase